MEHGFERFFIDLAAAASSDLVQRLACDGLATVRGVETRTQLIALARRLGEIRHHVDGEDDGVTVIAPRPWTGESSRTGFSSLGLDLHTDGSSLPRPPNLVLVACSSEATAGGATVLADGAAAHGDLARTAPAALAALSAPGGARFGAPSGFEGAVYSSVHGTGRLHVRFRRDAAVWYSPEAQRSLPLFLSVLRSRSYTFQLGAGEGYVRQNGRWLHGRTAFCGPRSMLRVLCEPNAPALDFGFQPQRARTPHDALPGRRVH